MLKTQRSGDGHVVFTLSGRIETAEEIEELQQVFAIETSGKQLILDLRDVTLVTRDAVQFLRRCEADGIKLDNCPLHVRRWIDQLEDRPKRRGSRKSLSDS
jgi:hypothetical protein